MACGLTAAPEASIGGSPRFVGVQPTLRHLSRTSEEQHVTVRVGDLEAAQTIRSVLERIADGCAALGKFVSQRVGIGRVTVRIPSHRWIAFGIGERRGFAGLDKKRSSVTAD